MQKPWDTPIPIRTQLALNARSQAPQWQDISSTVMGSGVSITRGRPRRYQRSQSMRCQVTVDNSNGAFSDIVGQPVTLFGKRLRVSYRNPSSYGLYSLLGFLKDDIEAGTYPGGTGGHWWTQYFGGTSGTTLASSTARFFSGTKSALVTWSGSASPGVGFFMPASTMVKGRRYVVSVPVFVPAGSPAVRLADVFGATPTVTSTATDQWQILQISFVATGFTPFIGLRPASAPSAGNQVWFDIPMIDEAIGTEPATNVDSGKSNLATNPKLGTGSTFWSANPGGGGGTATFSRVTSAGPNSEAIARATFGGTFTGTTGGLTYGLSGTDAAMAANPGDQRSATAWVRCSKSQRLSLYVQYLNGVGTSLQSTNAVVVVAANTWTEVRLDQAVAAPAGTVQTHLLVYAISGTGSSVWAAGDTLDATLICPVNGPSASPFFDGSTINDHPAVQPPGSGAFFANGSATITTGVSFRGRNDWTRVDVATATHGARKIWPARSLLSSRSYVVDFDVANDTGSARTMSVDICDGAPVTVSVAAGEAKHVTMTLTPGPNADINPASYRFLDLAVQSIGSLLFRNVTLTPSLPSMSVWAGAADASTTQQFADAFTQLAPPIKDRFTGTIGGNSTKWPANGIARTPITAVDRSARLATRTATFRGVGEQETLSTAPHGLWPLSDPAGTAAAGDISGNDRTALTPYGTGTAVIFGQDQVDNTSPATGATFAAGQSLRADIGAKNGIGFLSNAVSLAAPVRTTAAALQTIGVLGDGYGPNWVIQTTAAGKAQAQWLNVFDWSGVARPTVTGTVTVNDGKPHTVLVTVTLSAGTVTLRLYVDGNLDGTATTAATFLPNSTVAAAGGGWGLSGFTGVIGPLAIWGRAITATEAGETAAAFLTGFHGEQTQDRLARYCRWAGIPDTEIVLDPDPAYRGTMAHVDTTDMAPWDAMTMCETVEGGLLSIDGSGRVRFRSRGADYNQAPMAVIPAAMLRDSLEYTTDQSLLVNDLEGTRPGGATQRVINQASIDEYEIAEDSITVAAADDNQVSDLIAWQLGVLSEPESRADGLSVRLTQLDDILTDQVMDLEPGDRVDVLSLPSQAGTTDDALLAQGWTESYSINDGALWSADAVRNGSPVWTVGDPVYGALDGAAVIAY